MCFLDEIRQKERFNKVEIRFEAYISLRIRWPAQCCRRNNLYRKLNTFSAVLFLGLHLLRYLMFGMTWYIGINLCYSSLCKCSDRWIYLPMAYYCSVKLTMMRCHSTLEYYLKGGYQIQTLNERKDHMQCIGRQ